MLKHDHLVEFLEESNAIEGVYGGDALRQALEAWNYLAGHDELTINVLLKTHKILMTGQPLQPDQRGYLRKVDVHVGMHKMPPPHLLRAFLDNWLQRSNDEDPDWKELHVEYENIHPFADGNGRTGRMFMNWTRIKRCDLPVLVIREVERQEYYQWFKR